MQPARTRLTFIILFAATISLAGTLPADAKDPLVGRWDLTMQSQQQSYPSWIEVRLSGNSTLVGGYVGQFGSVRPIAEVKRSGNQFEFTVPPQWEARTDDVTFRGTISGEGQLAGSTTDDAGKKVSFAGKRAPDLKRTGTAKRGATIELINGTDLAGWKPMFADVENGWIVRDGILFNQKPGNNLVTKEAFTDFELHAEFRYPKGSNSGIYLRGRYEVQIEDNFGGEAESHLIGGVYGFLTPSVNAAKPANEWQSYDIELRGRTITVHLNGERVIDRQVIPGITGGAIDSNEAEPGPIYLQGDHGPVEFRKLTLTPLN